MTLSDGALHFFTATELLASSSFCGFTSFGTGLYMFDLLCLGFFTLLRSARFQCQGWLWRGLDGAMNGYVWGH